MAALTILGIVIGPATIVSLVAATQGFSNAQAAQFNQLGSTTILVSTGFFQSSGGGAAAVSNGGSGGVSISQSDVTAIQAMQGVSAVLPYDSLSGSITVGGVRENVQVMSTDLTELQTVIPSLTLQSGSLPSSSDITSAAVGSSVAYPGSSATANLTVDQVITVSGFGAKGQGSSSVSRSFVVQGIYSPFGTGFLMINPDQTVFVPLSVGESMKHNYNFDGLLVVASSPSAVSQVESAIDSHFDNKVSATSASTFLSFQQTISESTTTLLEAVAGISVLVAFIGIMTTMFTTVLERTKEIGILKALGATGRHIMLAFVSEALLTGFIGGVIGAASGSALSFVIVFLLSNGSGGILGLGGARTVGSASSTTVAIVPAITPELLLAAIALASAVGMLAGLFPAWRASKLPPVEALRSV